MQEDQGGEAWSNAAYEKYVSNGQASQRRDSPLIIWRIFEQPINKGGEQN